MEFSKQLRMKWKLESRKKYISEYNWDWNDPAYSALEYALITPEKARPEKIKIKLQNILKRFP